MPTWNVFEDGRNGPYSPRPPRPAQLRQLIIDTAAASGQREASVRYWLSAGPGGFGLSSAECVGSSFYVMIFQGLSYPESYYPREGMKVVTSAIPIKPPPFARIKSTNYLPNVLMILEARDHGADNGLFIDERGMVGESSNMNVAFVTTDRVFRHPTFDAILSGITVQRLLHLAQRLVTRRPARHRGMDISLDEACSASRDDAHWQLHQRGASSRMGWTADW